MNGSCKRWPPPRFVEELDGGRDLYVVLAGDFNAGPETGSIRFWSGHQSLDGTSVSYLDAWESQHATDPPHLGSTLVPGNPLVSDRWRWPKLGRRIDYVFVRCGDRGPTLDVSASDRVLDEPVGGVWASDHFGVMADLLGVG